MWWKQYSISIYYSILIKKSKKKGDPKTALFEIEISLGLLEF